MKITKKDKKNWFKDISENLKSNSISSKIREQFSSIVEIPSYVTTNMSKITIINNNSILIEGYKNVVDYYEHYIKISCNNLTILIDGKKLNINEITSEELLISGEIFSINFKKQIN
jgi:sporulation protein YqfC